MKIRRDLRRLLGFRFRGTFALSLVTVLGGCASEAGGPSELVSSVVCDVGAPKTDSSVEAVSWKCVGPAGGTVPVPPGGRTQLVIPPGALSQATQIVIRRARSLGPQSMSLRFEPEGLTFGEPVILELAYDEPPDGEPPILQAFYASTLHETRDAGSEKTNWEFAEVVAHDELENVFRIALPHFSVLHVHWGIQEVAYLVVDIPDEYMRPGDIMVALTKVTGEPGPNWRPGHVGIFRGDVTPSSSIRGVIESVPEDGVVGTLASRFRTGSGHLYLGPRRPPGNVLNDNERFKAIAYARLQDTQGAGYSLVGFGAIDNFSCVGIVEEALDAAGRGVLSNYREFWGGTPYDMYLGTSPVEQITVKVGDQVKIPVYAVAMDPFGPFMFRQLRGWYSHWKRGEIRYRDLPPGATFERETFYHGGRLADRYNLTWTPTLDQIGETYNVLFDLDGEVPGRSINYRLAGKLGLTVSGYRHDFTVRPGNRNESGATYSVYQNVPLAAEIRGTRIVDLATGEEPSPVPFPDHRFVILHLGRLEGDSTRYGITFRVRNTEGTVISAPDQTWRFTVDHSPGDWQGDLNCRGCGRLPPSAASLAAELPIAQGSVRR